MFKNIFKLPGIILLFLSGYAIFAKANPPVPNNSHPHKQASFASAVQHSPGQEFVNTNGTPLQIASLQRHKTVHSIKCINSQFNIAVIQIKYIHFICGTYISELSRFRKLILFPFHVFW